MLLFPFKAKIELLKPPSRHVCSFQMLTQIHFLAFVPNMFPTHLRQNYFTQLFLALFQSSNHRFIPCAQPLKWHCPTWWFLCIVMITIPRFSPSTRQVPPDTYTAIMHLKTLSTMTSVGIHRKSLLQKHCLK